MVRFTKVLYGGGESESSEAAAGAGEEREAAREEGASLTSHYPLVQDRTNIRGAFNRTKCSGQ